MRPDLDAMAEAGSWAETMDLGRIGAEAARAVLVAADVPALLDYIRELEAQRDAIDRVLLAAIDDFTIAARGWPTDLYGTTDTAHTSLIERRLQAWEVRGDRS